MDKLSSSQQMILDILESSRVDITKGGSMAVMLKGGHTVEGVVSFFMSPDNHGTVELITKGMSPIREKEVDFYTCLPIDNIIAVQAEYIGDDN